MPIKRLCECVAEVIESLEVEVDAAVQRHPSYQSGPDGRLFKVGVQETETAPR